MSTLITDKIKNLDKTKTYIENERLVNTDIQLENQQRVVQVKYGIVHDIYRLYSRRTDAYTSRQTIISPMNAVITPKHANSAIIWRVMLNGEVHHDTNFVILKNNRIAPDGQTNNKFMRGDNYWGGFLSPSYDTASNNNSTPHQYKFLYIDECVGTTDQVYYSIGVKSSSTGNQTFALNCCVGGAFPAGQNSYEIMVSTWELMEVVYG